VREDGEHRLTPRTLDAPDGEPTQPDTDLMRAAGQAPTAVTGRVVGELNAKRQHELDRSQEMFEDSDLLWRSRMWPMR
jgi:hypothetical protein